MKKILLYTCVVLLTIASCKKDKKNDNDSPGNTFGPFTIYGELACPANTVPVLVANYVDIYGGTAVETTTSHTPPEPENPEFYLKKTGSGSYLVYIIQKIANEITYWVWYESDQTTNCNFTESGCRSIGLESFKDLNNVNGNQYIFKFFVEDLPGVQETLIEAPSGRHLYSGKGLERNTGLCNRSTVAFLASSAPCREIKEFEKIWDYCFSTRFFFIKKP